MYRIVITAEAQAGADSAFEWMAANISQEFAERWYQELFKQIDTLTKLPTRCPLAHEAQKFAGEIRELSYGKRRHKHKYRILFTIQDEVVLILYVYHSARKELEP